MQASSGVDYRVNFPDAMKPAAERVQRVLDEYGLPCRVVELPASTRTAAEAAAAIGCDVAQIAKSIVFRGIASRRAIVVVASGNRRVDEAAVTEAAGEPIERAAATWVKDAVGYTIGGVPPIGHLGDPVVLFDSALLDFETVWAAAGTPNAVFEVPPDALLRASRSTLVDLS